MKARAGWGVPARYPGIPHEGAGGVGVPRQKRMGILLQRRGQGGGFRREVRWLECGRQGRGNEFPLPASRHPPWRYHHGPVPGDRWERAGYGFPPAPPQIRFPAGSTPGTAAHLISPRTDPAPGGGGGGAPEARAGWGRPAEEYGYSPCRRRGRGGGRWQRVHGYLYGGAGGVGRHGLRCPGSWRQGRGNKFPLPVGPTPNGDITPVQYTGRTTGKGRIRLPAGSTPDTASHQVSPRTDPAPKRGRGRSAEGAGGVGVPRQRVHG